MLISRWHTCGQNVLEERLQLSFLTSLDCWKPPLTLRRITSKSINTENSVFGASSIKKIIIYVLDI